MQEGGIGHFWNMRAPPRDWHTILDGYGSKDFHHDEEDVTWIEQNQVKPGKRMLVWLSPQEIRTLFFLIVYIENPNHM